jgi:quercetin dioxygenase-like cupin family protein
MAKPLFDATTTHFANLSDSCPIVAGAIVSKPMIDTGTLKQILFAMDAGQDISEHRAPYVATVHVLSGRLRFAVGSQTREMGPSDWLVMPSNEPHDLTALEPTLFLLTLVKG